MNRCTLTDEVKEKYKPIIKDWLDKIKNMSVNEIEQADNSVFCLQLSDTELRPSAD